MILRGGERVAVSPVEERCRIKCAELTQRGSSPQKRPSRAPKVDRATGEIWSGESAVRKVC